MPTPHEPEQPTDGPYTPADQCLTETVGTVEHCLCGLVGLLCTGLGFAVLYPTLVAVTEPLSVLSSTALVAIAATVWLLTSLGVEFVWEWQSGRVTTEP